MIACASQPVPPWRQSSRSLRSMSASESGWRRPIRGRRRHDAREGAAVVQRDAHFHRVDRAGIVIMEVQARIQGVHAWVGDGGIGELGQAGASVQQARRRRHAGR